MKIKAIQIHNFRSILDSGKVFIDNLSLLVGPNNAGKSNFMCVLRMLYDEEKFNSKNDFPSSHLRPVDNETWLDVTYALTDDEHDNLPDYAKNFPGELRIRKYFKSDNPDRVKPNQSNIYAYEAEGQLSAELFFGAKNVSEAKLGKVIFIPSVNKTDEIMKTSGPSPWRQIATFVFEQVSKKSPAFAGLDRAFEDFNKDFRKDSSVDGHSLQGLVNEVNSNLGDWDIKFDVDIKKLRSEDIIKNLLGSYLKDESLGGQQVDPNLHGQGFQRHLIYTLIKLSAKYVEKKVSKKKEFVPDFTLILFEEPEAFLHPAQQETLSASLYDLSKTKDESVQVLLSTHSPVFVSRNTDDLSGIVRLCRKNGETKTCQISNTDEQQLFGQNTGLSQYLQTIAADMATSQDDKADIDQLLSNQDPSLSLQLETMKYFMWLNSERCAAFFADFVFICEGTTEKALLEYLIRNDSAWSHLRKRKIYFLDAGGKYNMHRYMNLFELLCIDHSVILDSDSGGRKHHKYVNDYIDQNKNGFTHGVHMFATDFEDFLGVPAWPIGDRRKSSEKPAWAFLQYQNGTVTQTKIDDLRNIIESLLNKN